MAPEEEISKNIRCIFPCRVPEIRTEKKVIQTVQVNFRFILNSMLKQTNSFVAEFASALVSYTGKKSVIIEFRH